MPIYHKTPPSTVGNHNTAEIDYHTSEAAKVKRTREQAYFNSYDFDAIEVLPYDDDEEEDDKRRDGKRERGGKTNSQIKQQLKTKQIRQQNKIMSTSHPHQPVKLQKSLNHHSFSNDSSSNNSFMVDSHHHHSKKKHQQLQTPLQHQHHHGNSKYNPSMYLQRITGIFATNKSNNNSSSNSNSNSNNKHQQHNSHNSVGSRNETSNSSRTGGGGGDMTALAVVVNAMGHDNKHIKLSSSETSSTSLSSSSIVEEIVVNVDDTDVVINESVVVNGGAGGVIATANGGLVNRASTLECARDVIGTSARTKSMEGTGTSSTAVAVTAASTSSSAAGNGGNFSLPRAMLKYQQSTTQQQQQGVSGNTNSMPLATYANSSNSNNSNSSRQQTQQEIILAAAARDVHKLDGIKATNPTIANVTTTTAMMPTSGRLKKTSTTSSVITSLASEDIEEVGGLEDTQVDLQKEAKVLPKTINPKASARASSHQSHYSTDKSASSGYYSSNVCSTYSLEEHIYSEPTIDLKKIRNHGKENKATAAAAASSSSQTTATAIAKTPSSASTLQTNNKLMPHHHHHQLTGLLSNSPDDNSVMQQLDFNRRYRYADNDLQLTQRSQTLPSKRSSQEFNENLKILESSIENLDRHLKAFPGGNSQDALVALTQHNPYNPYSSVHQNEKLRASTSYQHLPTIQEGFDAVKKQSWPEVNSDDSLMDIDLDSFLLDKDQKLSHKTKEALSTKGLDNPSFLPEEQEENHYKCAKYINSCPEDAYRVESDIHGPARSSISGQSVAVSVDLLYPKRYEEQLHFQNTRELLEDVRDKIRLLTQSQEADQQQQQQQQLQQHQLKPCHQPEKEDYIPKELNTMINTLKQELELYLDRMNQHSELEIRQLCSGLMKNQNIVKMKNAFERRRSLTEAPDIYSTYEAIQDGIIMNAQGVPISIRQQITSIRCSSDPNFKMKRKSITEVFPMAECYVETVPAMDIQGQQPSTSTNLNENSQIQRNLSYHKPVLEQLGSNNGSKNVKATNTSSGGDSSEANDKDSILDWHRKKPSIWEMYYGTNRIQQSLLGGNKKNGMMVTTALASSPSTMCYPSSRPESDFTLDMPRAEQLRIKMEKEKKFRHRCRVITTFLSLVFFLLTVMVVSLVLTRGKRMFGSMI